MHVKADTGKTKTIALLPIVAPYYHLSNQKKTPNPKSFNGAFFSQNKMP